MFFGFLLHFFLYFGDSLSTRCKDSGHRTGILWTFNLALYLIKGIVCKSKLKTKDNISLLGGCRTLYTNGLLEISVFLIVTSNGSLDRNGAHQWVGAQCYDNNYVIMEDRLKLLAIHKFTG